MANSDRVAIPPKENMNRNLSPAREQTMLRILGRPGRLTRDCSEPTGAFARRVVARNVGPFRVRGLDFAVESLERIFAEVKEEHPDVFNEVKNEGVLCVRHRRTNPARFSNHSWGCAVDLFFGSRVVDQGDAVTHRGNLILFPFFNKHGWYWGAEFGGDSVDSMHFELAEETILKLGRDDTEPSGGGADDGDHDHDHDHDHDEGQALRSELLRSDAVLIAVAAGDRVLRRSDVRQRGVGTLQDALNRLGANNPAFLINLGTGNRNRGIFGPRTDAAVRAFQASASLEADGVVGEDTITALDAALVALTT